MVTLSEREIHLGQVLREWAVAEEDRIAQASPQLGQIVGRVATSSSSTPQDVALAVYGAFIVRGQFFAHFVAQPTKWFEASVPVSEIGALYLCRYFEAYEHLPERPNLRTIGELAQRDASFRLKDPFDPSRMKGRPALVSHSPAGPLCVLEGTHRLVAIHRLVKAGTPPIESLNVIVGICAQAKDWHMWRPRP